MRKIIVSINVTLDGFMAESNGALDWHFPLWDNEMAKYAYRQLSRADTILLGRVTYQGMAAYYPAAGRNKVCTPNIDTALANMMNNYPKIIFSRTLQAVDWRNATLATATIAEEIAQLRQHPGKHLMIFGSGSLIASFMQLDLIDEYLIWVHPVILGKGNPLFKGLDNKLNLNLLKTKRFDSGVVVLDYEVLHRHKALV